MDHISQQFDADLGAIKGHVLGMGGLVERQIGDALHAIIEADSQRAEEILAREREVNRMEVAVDDEATRILVKRQPAASDLRTVLALIKTVRDLERVGDEAKKIAKLALKLTEEGPSPRGYHELRHIGAAVGEMLHDALDAMNSLLESGLIDRRRANHARRLVFKIRDRIVDNMGTYRLKWRNRHGNA